MFVPIGTRVIAPDDGRVYAVGNTIGPMTGRWIGIDMTNGMRFRCMHHSEILLKPGKLVERGQDIAISGASGYGYEDWSKRSDMPDAHTHATLWPTHQSIYGYRPNGTPYSIDIMNFIATTGGGEVPAPAPVPYYRRPYVQGEIAMSNIAVKIKDGRGMLGPVGKTRTYIVGGSYFVDTTDDPNADLISVLVQRYDAEGKVQPVPNLTYLELYKHAKASCALTPAELAPYARAAGLPVS